MYDCIPLLSLCVFLHEKNTLKGKVQTNAMQFTFLASAMQSHASIVLFSSINGSNTHAFHMSSHRVNYMWSHADISMHSSASLRIDYILCSHVLAPHMLLHSYIICSSLPLCLCILHVSIVHV